MPNRTCSTGDDGSNAQAATQKGYSSAFARVYIEISNVAGDTVQFKPKGSSTIYSALWKDPEVWPGCPTEITAPVSTDEGFAYIGAPIYNQFDAGAKAHASRLKWPEELGLSEKPKAVELTPLLLRIVGVDKDGTPRDTAGLILPEQTIDLTKFYSSIVVPGDPQPETVQVQVLQLLVTATSVKTTIQATVDLFNPLLSDAFQAFKIPKAGSTTVQLTRTGRTLFGLG